MKKMFTRDKKYSKYFRSQWDTFLIDRKRVIFAYSGGLDSTVVLHSLNQDCKKLGLKLICFTLNHGFKGYKTIENIQKVIDFESLTESHYFLDISKMPFDRKNTIEEYFAHFCTKNIVPCGKKCNNIFNELYQKILTGFGESYLVTGGDTPILDSTLGKYSIFWKKRGYVVVRGGVVFNITKESNLEFVKREKIPWENPGCGGYDTDCLIPGGILRNMVEKGVSVGQIHSKVPQIENYLRTRQIMGVLSDDEFSYGMKNIDISNDKCFKEFNQIVAKKICNSINV